MFKTVKNKKLKNNILKKKNKTLKRDKNLNGHLKYDMNNYNIDNDLLILVGDKYVDYKNEQLQRYFLKKISQFNKINIQNIKIPRQHKKNCWFNVWLMSYYISDNGRKLYTYVRQFMVNGHLNGLSQTDSKLLFLLNMYIESIFGGIHIVDRNTNYLIKLFNRYLPKSPHIYGVGDKGNPSRYQQILLNYIDIKNDNIINIYNHDIYLYKNIECIDKQMFQVEIKKKYMYVKNKKTIIFDDKNNNYKLDSCIIKDINGSHFGCFLTINNNEYLYDGNNDKLIKINWKHLINEDKNINVKGNKYTWNFMKGYQILLYYKC